MADAHLLRDTLDAVDDFVERLRSEKAMSRSVDPRLLIDEGRAAAEWTLDLEFDGVVRRIGLLVVCDVSGDHLTDARLYAAVPTSTTETP